jgi:hypothetical protein
MLEHPRHFPGCRRHARDRHDRVAIDLEDFVGAIVNDRVAGGGAAIARDEHAALEFEGEDCGGLGLWDIRPWRRRTYRAYWTYMTHAPKQPNEIIGATSASGWVHHWPVRCR